MAVRPFLAGFPPDLLHARTLVPALFLSPGLPALAPRPYLLLFCLECPPGLLPDVCKHLFRCSDPS